MKHHEPVPWEDSIVRGEDVSSVDRPAREDPLDRPASDVDILMCYHLLLGRDLENSNVIHEAKQHSLRKVIHGFLDSQEFKELVENPLWKDDAIPHQEGSLLVTPGHRAWLTAALRLPAEARGQVMEESSWSALLRIVLGALQWRREGAPPAAPTPAASSTVPDMVGNDLLRTIMSDISRKMESLNRDVTFVRKLLGDETI